jgi:hypothetical protein
MTEPDGMGYKSELGIGSQFQHQTQVCQTWLLLPWHIGNTHRGCRKPAPASTRTQQSHGALSAGYPGAPWDRSK